MDLIENDPLDLSHNLTASINHVPQDFCCHDETCCILVDGDITCNQTHIIEFFLQLSVLLIWQSLDWRCVNDSASVFKWISDGVLSDCCLTGRCMCTYEDWLITLNCVNTFALERIELEFVLFGVVCSMIIFSNVIFGIKDFVNTALFLSLHENFNIFRLDFF